jgi:hypothetical protein
MSMQRACVRACSENGQNSRNRHHEHRLAEFEEFRSSRKLQPQINVFVLMLALTKPDTGTLFIAFTERQ